MNSIIKVVWQSVHMKNTKPDIADEFLETEWIVLERASG